MTADERIEKLVGAFGQTISDLPKPVGFNPAYDYPHRHMANKTAIDWSNGIDLYSDYICHLCDVIDRMEAALETARRWMPCSTCEFNGDFYVCDNDLDVCTYRICDKNLRDMAIGADPEHLKRETPEERSDRVGTDSKGD